MVFNLHTSLSSWEQEKLADSRMKKQDDQHDVGRGFGKSPPKHSYKPLRTLHTSTLKSARQLISISTSTGTLLKNTGLV